MWLRDELRTIEEHLINFLNVITARAEQGIDYAIPSFGCLLYRKLPDAANPDSLELLRGEWSCLWSHGRFYDTQRGLASTYNKDLEESTKPMLDHVKTVSDSIQIAKGVLLPRM
jgi:argininosuccinate lyase